MSNRSSAAPFLVAASLLWGLAFIAWRAVDAEGMQAYSVIGGRTLLAAATFLVLVPTGRVRRIPKRDLGMLFLVAATGQFGYLLLYHLGAGGVSAATASLIINLAPVIGTVAGALVLNEHLARLNWIGVCVAVIGTVTVSLGDGGDLSWSGSITFVFLAAILAGIYMVGSKPLVDRHGAITVTAWGWWMSSPLAALFLPRLINDLTNTSGVGIANLVFLGVFSSVGAYLCWGFGLERTSASTASTYLFSLPVIAMVAAWLILGEKPTGMTMVGGAITLIGVGLTTRRAT